MEQPPGYIKEEEKHLVCKLQRSLYGLNQSSRCWNSVLKEYVESINFEQSLADPCVFVRKEGENVTIIAVYVDNLIVITKGLETMEKLKKDLTGIRFR